MSTRIPRTIVIAGAALLVIAGAFLLSKQIFKASRGESAPRPAMSGLLPATMVDFTLPDLDGKPRHLADWKGKFLIVNFWATWCPPCRKEIPLFIDMQTKYGKRGLQIIGVAVDKKKDVMNFRDFNFINYPILSGQEDAMNIMAKYGDHIGSLPYSVVIDQQGRVLGRKVGAYQPAELQALLDSLLPKHS